MAADTLVVIAPGVSSDGRRWANLIARLQAEPDLAGAVFHFWNHRAYVWRRARGESLARQLVAIIDEQWAYHGEPSRVILMGASIGGLLVRRAYLIAIGDNVDRRPRPWVTAVTRLVLFAAINRGLNGLNPSGSGALTLRALYWLGRVVPFARSFLIYELFRGSPFISNLRINWIAQLAVLGERAPIAVQLLSQDDWLVKREDSEDIEQFPTGWHIEIPNAKHKDVYRPERAENPDARYALIRNAVLAQGNVGESRPIQGPSTVVFAVHGIRANNRHWSTQLCERLRARDASIVALPLQYEFVSAAQFAIPWTRRRHLFWLQDEYTRWLAKNPTASFRFVGHSNGTYLLGQSLLALPGMRFERVAFVGAVLPQDYPLRRLLENQIGHLRNVRSNRDWPVAFLCSALRGLRMTDIGSSGYGGFHDQDGHKREVFFYEGGHSAPLAERELDTLVDFLLADDPASLPVPAAITSREYRLYELAPRLMPRLMQLISLGAMAFLVWWGFLDNGLDIWRLGVLAAVALVLLVILDTL